MTAPIDITENNKPIEKKDGCCGDGSCGKGKCKCRDGACCGFMSKICGFFCKLFGGKKEEGCCSTKERAAKEDSCCSGSKSGCC